MLKNKIISFLGAGNMAEAITIGLLNSAVKKENIILFDIKKERLDFLKDKYGTQTTQDNSLIFNKSDIIVIAVKPQQIDEAIYGLLQKKEKVQKKKIIISIAAGIKIKKIQELIFKSLDENEKKLINIIRVMPNTPALVGSAISGFFANSSVSEEDIEITKAFLETFGKAILFEKEEILNEVTAISGSGPAYFFYFFEAMIEGAKTLGFNEKEAKLLVSETISGSLKLLDKTKEEPKDLRKKVTSPGGTTEAAIKVFEEGKLKQVIENGIKAALKRSIELSEK